MWARSRRLVPAVIVLAGVILVTGRPLRVAAQSDLDALMREVIERRDENWTQLQQYVLDEREQMRLTGPSGALLWGERRDYTWYIRDSLFVRSPLRVNGASVGEEDRRRAEQQFIRRELERERRRRARQADVAAANPANAATNDSVNDSTPDSSNDASDAPDVPGNDVTALMRQGRQPQFISSAYFLRFRFESGKYALVGRETVDGREALKIEYYPTNLFREPPPRQSDRPGGRRRADDPVEREARRLMNKVSLVTLWVEPKQRQVLKYTFDNVTLDFLPSQWLARITDVKASMTMGQPFSGVWLPHRIDVTVAGTIATGAFQLQYGTEYVDYRRADVGSTFTVPGQPAPVAPPGDPNTPPPGGRGR